MGADDDWPDWLPFDWMVNIRKIDGRTVKCYDDSKGHTFYSKPDVLAYLKKIGKSAANENTQNADDSTIDLSADLNAPHTNEASESLPGGRPTKLTPRTSRRKSNSRNLSEDAMANHGSASEPLSSERTDKDSWLPEGWTVEVKVRQGGSSTGMRYKCYTDPETGQKFFSKPQVLHHLAKTNRSAGKQKEVLTEPIIATPISAWQGKSTTEPDKSKTNEATKVKKTGTGITVKSVRLSSDYEVISRTPVEGLPAGWIKEDRLRKNTNKKDPYYLDPLSEYAFFSKKDALRYLETGDVRSCVMKPILRDVNNDDIHNANLSASIEELIPPSPPKVTETPKKLPNASVEESKTNESGTQSPKRLRSITGGVFNSPDEEKNSDWLPDGWAVEINYKNSGMKFKVFKEVATGKKFYSKPQVLNYLGGGSSSNSIKRKERKPSAVPGSTSSPTPADATRPKRSSKKTDDNKNSDFQEIITTSAADGLPPGWIKEVRTKIYATHKRSDPFYTDPESGYIFRSKMDAMRYLDTGDVNLCAIRPKVKDENGKEVFVSTNAAQKPAKPTTGKQPLEDKDGDAPTENHEENQTADNAKRKSTKQQNNPAASSPGQRSSKRQKGIDPGPNPTSEGNKSGQAKPAPWVNLEKQPADDGNLAYDIPEDDGWTDQCIDFAVKTLANEILFNGQPLNGPSGFQEDKNETPTKVN
ncbi:uncharacterized protein LOC143616509 [Bidens hawaiensis]|uniref:uncharacterized protein LOC143616509 n=1 Tax=Bidens hawaiensis TaxID=980011 RepID=UPI004049F447